MTQPRLLGGRYELDGVVGRGGMAEVYRARDIRLDRVVAIKTLRADLARDHTFQARFRREAQSAASLNHPSIVAVYDTGEDMTEGTPVPYIVMEFVDGRTLRDLLRADRRLLPERAAELVDGILRALDYSHRGGIVHRDIKPANVMITLAGDVKVMDFGIARAMADSAATMTQTAQVIGTAQYLSPEQARGERVDARSDIYSTGCVLYELLTGQPPFTGDSPVAIAYQHVREDPIPPSQIDPDIPKWADAIVLKAMAKDPAHRYQSAAEMRADIQRAMSGMPVDAAHTMALSNNNYTGQQTRTLNAPGGPATQRTNAVPAYEYAPTQAGGGRYERRRAASGGNTALKTAAWILIPLIVIGAFIGVGYAFLSSPGTKDTATQVSIPLVKNQTMEAAKAKLEAEGLKVEVVEEFNADIDKGVVIGTDPAAGQQVAKGDTVKLMVSKGLKQVVVPDVIGSTVDEATQTLEANNLKAQVVPVVSGKEQEKVFQSKPAAGEKVDENSIVKIYVPKQQTEVPDVTGQTLADATATLKGAGFKVKPVRQTSADVPEGNVISQSPRPGSKLTPGTTITLVVSAGPPQETFPTDEPTDQPTEPTDQPPSDQPTDDPFSDPPADNFGN
ncbi:Stk1 family PASTA domain-containing Ser/Thr kinase [Sphaerisporangium perillae]|uniref:Stk1 family PASTA domain-containing Ser/Thr kinase n=1 Tax=Sphaerisporangium perillae TaxID=2935860 RepID=UPI00200D5D96|nr:Stk1 family PASTA domain-containing Ser/Thr kinase [Sphaerisporangium perillae]